MIYLDYAATTPVDRRVADAMWQYLGADTDFGNAGSTTHRFGYRAKQAVDRARSQVAAVLNADERELIWTSGATEANNLAIKGAMLTLAANKRHVITCQTEHKAVLDCCKALERDGFRVSYLAPQSDGCIDLAALDDAIQADTGLVSLMHVNNETGVKHDIAAIGAITRQRGVLLHVDAAQSAGKLPLDMQSLPVDLLSLCGHKIYGPKGIGALYVRRRPRVRLTPLLHGGGQERGLRAGTLPVHQIVGLAEALQLAQAEMTAETQRLQVLRALFFQEIAQLDKVVCHGAAGIANIFNISFLGIDAEALLMELDDIALSTGSACTSASAEPSHVLTAMGIDGLAIQASVRFSLGRFTTEQEIIDTAQQVVAGVQRLRALSPLA